MQVLSEISIYEACIIATRGNNVIKMNITIDKEEYLEARIPFPLTICSAGTGMKAKNCCLEVTKMNRKEASACAFVSFEVDTKWYIGKTECFKIPASGIAVDEAVDYKDEDVDNNDDDAVDYMESPNDAGKVFRLGPILKFLTFSSNAKQTRLK
ncbi:uncharacterized protein LOC123542454 [Mercenaria mercenaria]|uniref:uncharacterized protein LOC123542454 n=1 Tax=Mercenaria mercenaria TaxID=6596 RepID=UPI00234E50D3|nr:uncharacterized protein LOC123542454 [Mercenaria mercenaria]